MFDRLADIIDADTGDLRVLAKKAGADPITFYRGAILQDVDLRGQDLRGLDFTGADFAGAIVDVNTRIDERFAEHASLDYKALLQIEVRARHWDFVQNNLDHTLRTAIPAARSMVWTALSQTESPAPDGFYVRLSISMTLQDASRCREFGGLEHILSNNLPRMLERRAMGVFSEADAGDLVRITMHAEFGDLPQLDRDDLT